MDKQTFRKKWYYPLLQIAFWGSLLLIVGALALASVYEDDIPAAGFFWAGLVTFAFWFAKRLVYFALFKDKILPRKSSK